MGNIPPAPQPTALDRYRVLRTLGQGGSGTVYLARDTKLERDVALKVLGPAADNPDARRRFALEARSIATLKHPNIVQLYDYADEGAAELFLVMEYVDGPSLEDILERHGPLAEPLVLCVGHAVATALAYAHAQRLVHRDVKPGNLVLRAGAVVLLDFGSIKVVGPNAALGVSRAHDTTQAIGTPGFMAPEQLIGRAIDRRTDIYALGSTLYTLATDALPRDGQDAGAELVELLDAATRGRFKDPRTYQPLLSPGFCGLLEDCLAPNPEHRLQDMQQVLERLDALLAQHGVTDPAGALAAFARQPEQHELVLQGRSVAALTRELESALIGQLRLAIRNRDQELVQQTLVRLEAFADVEVLRRNGVLPATLQAPSLAQRRTRRRWLLVGALLGAALGALAHYAVLYLTEGTGFAW